MESRSFQILAMCLLICNSIASTCFSSYKPYLFGAASCDTKILTFELSNNYLYLGGMVSGNALLGQAGEFPFVSKVRDGGQTPIWAKFLPDFPSSSVSALTLGVNRVVIGINYNYKLIIMVLYQGDGQEDFQIQDNTGYGSTTEAVMIKGDGLAIASCLGEEVCLFASMMSPANFWVTFWRVGSTLYAKQSAINEGQAGPVSVGTETGGNLIVSFSGRYFFNSNWYYAVKGVQLFLSGSTPTDYNWHAGFYFGDDRILSRSSSVPGSMSEFFMCSDGITQHNVHFHYINIYDSSGISYAGSSLKDPQQNTFSACLDLKATTSDEAYAALQKVSGSTYALCKIQMSTRNFQCSTIMNGVYTPLYFTRIASFQKFYIGSTLSVNSGTTPWEENLGSQIATIISTDMTESCFLFTFDETTISEGWTFDNTYSQEQWSFSNPSGFTFSTSFYWIENMQLEQFFDPSACGPQTNSNSNVLNPTISEQKYCINDPTMIVDASLDVNVNCEDGPLTYTVEYASSELATSSSEPFWYEQTDALCDLNCYSTDNSDAQIYTFNVFGVAPNRQSFQHNFNVEYLRSDSCECAKITCPDVLSGDQIFYPFETITSPSLTFNQNSNTPCTVSFSVIQSTTFIDEVPTISNTESCTTTICEITFKSDSALAMDSSMYEHVYTYEIIAQLDNGNFCSYDFTFEVVNNPCHVVTYESSFSVAVESSYNYDILIAHLSDPSQDYFAFSSTTDLSVPGCEVTSSIKNIDGSDADSIFSITTSGSTDYFNINTVDPLMVNTYHLVLILGIEDSAQSEERYYFTVYITYECLNDVSVEYINTPDLLYQIGDDQLIYYVSSWKYRTPYNIDCGLFTFTTSLTYPAVDSIPSSLSPSNFIAFEQLDSETYRYLIYTDDENFVYNSYQVRLESALASGWSNTQYFDLLIVPPCIITPSEVQNQTYLLGMNPLTIKIPSFTDPTFLYCPVFNYKFFDVSNGSELDSTVFSTSKSKSYVKLQVFTTNSTKIKDYEIKTSLVYKEIEYAIYFMVSIQCSVFSFRASKASDVTLTVGQNGRTTPFTEFEQYPSCNYNVFYSAQLHSGDQLPPYIRFLSQQRYFEIDARQNSSVGLYQIQVVAVLVQENGDLVSNSDFIIKVTILESQQVDNAEATQNQTIQISENVTLSFPQDDVDFQNYAYAWIKDITNQGEIIIIFDQELEIPLNYQSMNYSFIELTVFSQDKSEYVELNYTINSFSSSELILQVQFEEASEITDIYVIDTLHVKGWSNS